MAARAAVGCGVCKGGQAVPGLRAGRSRRSTGRAGYGVSLNIAEGHARRGSREYRRFLDTAKGSLAEVEAALDVALQLEYLTEEQHRLLMAIAEETGKTLFGLLRKISVASTHP
jgi:four helix bundle protein